ncbi:hypothetical protein PDESU_05149 [Pontiella desulfatans]|uniref:Right handed beta helix domain-containing protein n=1 Tax=Pontiella desulfatans TaxID=2750659 RepID=A0A6C2U8X7_PONDE|nr:right-handed parallel beta-helix repeat-containing protein [Pontiella desulfatans]VGO16558.1 hypothetical protein PDESU_05149 [Pontiella desulfatans]
MKFVPTVAFLSALAAGTAIAGTWHVDPSSPQDGPGTSWPNAFHSIQDAVNAAATGDTVLVTNGVYQPITVSKNITLSSINGPDVTLVDGSNTSRCAYVSGLATINGFSFVNGFANEGGGVLCDHGGTLENCVISGNSATTKGGGVMCNVGGTLSNCTISGNSVTATSIGTDWGGGGVYYNFEGALNNCTISSNSAAFTKGGGMFFYYAMGRYDWSQVRDCTIRNNDALYGGGIASTFGNYGVPVSANPITGCIVAENTATQSGGGAYLLCKVALHNCLILSNYANSSGGGAYLGHGILNHCTITENSINLFGGSAGGVCSEGTGSMTNSIIYRNWKGTFEYNWNGIGTLISCFTGEDPLQQTNNPCIDAALPIAGISDDFDGVPRPLDGDNNGTALPDIGAHEFVSSMADTDNDLLTDAFEVDTLGTSPVDENTDGDPAGDYAEYVADTDGTDPSDWFRILSITNHTLFFNASSNRLYTLSANTNLVEGSWGDVAGQTDIPGSGGVDSLTHPLPDPAGFYRIQVGLP